MGQMEVILFWATIFIYLTGFCFSVFGFVRTKISLSRRAVSVMTLGFCVHTATLIARWIAGNHVPVTNTYELNLVGMWFTVLVFLLFNRLKKVDSQVLMLIAPIVFLVMGHGYVL